MATMDNDRDAKRGRTLIRSHRHPRQHWRRAVAIKTWTNGNELRIPATRFRRQTGERWPVTSSSKIHQWWRTPSLN